MRCAFGVIFLFLFMWMPARSQQNTQNLRPDVAGVTSPVLLPLSIPVTTPKHCDELDGVVKFAATIDAAGLPHTVKSLEASDERLVGFATTLVEALLFKPGLVDGSPTPVAIELTIGLHTCAQREKHPVGDHFYDFALRAHPVIALAVVASPAVQETVSSARTEDISSSQIGSRISPPVPTRVIDPKAPISGRLPKHGHCFLSVTVDAEGVPQNVHVVRPLEPELDSIAVEAARRWRFKPALRDNSMPTAVEGTIVATFEYVDKEIVTFSSFFAEAPESVLAARANGGKRLRDKALEPINADEVIARYMPPSRTAGLDLVSLVVDTNGVPQDVHVIKSADSRLDMDTVAMVEHLRFKPVLTDAGTAVSVGIVMPVRYQRTIGRPTWKDVLSNGLALAVFALI